MRKRRSDSPWGKLTREQTRQMDIWRFEDNLSYAEIVKRALSEFGVTASEQTLTSYFRYRKEELDWEGDGPGMTFREKLAMVDRPGMGKKLVELEAWVLHFSGMAAYEMALADPEKMRVKEVRSLMKVLQDHRRFEEDRKMKAKKLELQEMALMAKVVKDKQGRHTKAEFEEMVMEATDVAYRAKMRAAEYRAAEKAEMAKAATANAVGIQEPKPEAGQGAAEEGRAAEPDLSRVFHDVIKDTEVGPQA